MQNLKNDIIKEALEHPDIVKTIEGISRTEINTDFRDKMIDVFYFEFFKVISNIFKCNFGNKTNKHIEIKVHLPLGTLTELQMIFLNRKSITKEKIYQILINHDDLEFEINFEKRKLMSVKQIMMCEDELMMIIQFFFSGNKRIDKIITKTLKALSKR